MTREEAIEYLNTLYMAFAVFPNQQISLGDVDKMKESVSMAIKALEQEPKLRQALEQEKGAYNALVKNIQCADAISRQAVLDGIDTYIYKAQSTGTQDDFYSFAELVVKALPPVKQEPKTGHWISHGEHCEMNNLRPSGLGSYFWCSECDCGIDANEWHMNNYNYCPNCGAKMIESEG